MKEKYKERLLRSRARDEKGVCLCVTKKGGTDYIWEKEREREVKKKNGEGGLLLIR